MPLKIIRQDITKIECDAIINPSNRFLRPGGGTDMAVHKAAGPRLMLACAALRGCEVGKAKITPGFNLPCRYVIHTAGPDWDREENAKELLASCYRECLKLAKENGCETVAFPLIASGSYGCPKDIVLKIATREISDFLFENEMLVYLVVYDKNAFSISEKIFCDVQSYIDDNYVQAHRFPATNRAYFSAQAAQPSESEYYKCCENDSAVEEDFSSDSVPLAAMPFGSMPSLTLDDMLRNMDKGFADTLFEYIDAKGFTDVECYKRSNVDKKTFSKIKCNKNYKPSKLTAVSLAIGLRLNLEETNRLLGTVGFCLSNSNMFDVIIQYFISTGNYDSIFDINEVLYSFDLSTLGV